MLTRSLHLRAPDTFAGSVDLAALSGPAEPPRASRGQSSVETLVRPGALIAWRGASASIATRDTAVCIAVGDAGLDDGRRDAIARERGLAAALLDLLDAEGAAGLAHLRDDYAFVYCDGARGRVIAAVDRFARHALCHRIDGTCLAFASRADEVPGDAPALDPQAIFNYAFHHVIPAPRTIFRGVHRLDAAHCLELTRAGASVRRHWAPQFTAVHLPFERRKAAFVSSLEQAVRRAATGEGTGCYLSGGTDSSTVAGMAARVRGDGVKTFSIGFDAAGYDEMAYARIAARHFRTDHHEYYVTPQDILETVPRIAAHYDQPFGNSSVLPSFLCAQLARSHGVTRMLAGDGGDELFGGNSRYREEQLFAVYGAIPRPLRRGAVEPLLRAASAVGGRRLHKLDRFVAVARMLAPDRQQRYNLLEHLGAAAVLAPPLLRSVDSGEPKAQMRAVYDDTPADAAPLDRLLAWEWKYILSDNDLCKVVGAAQLAGVATAFPLLDDDLVDLSLRLPSWDKVRGTRLRYFFKRALADFLPPEIITKKKHGFALPFGVWLLGNAQLRALATGSLESLRDRGVIAARLVDAIADSGRSEAPAYYGELVWVMMMLEQWLQAHAASYRVA